jgi:hypothetical protein
MKDHPGQSLPPALKDSIDRARTAIISKLQRDVLIMEKRLNRASQTCGEIIRKNDELEKMILKIMAEK